MEARKLLLEHEIHSNSYIESRIKEFNFKKGEYLID